VIHAPRLRRLSAVALLAVLALMTSACGSGFHSGTSQVKRPTNGSDGDVGAIAVRNLLLLQDKADPPVTSLIGGFVNNGDTPDQLKSVQVSAAGAVSSQLPLTVPGRGLVTPGSGGQTAIDVPNATFTPGGYATVTLTFQHAGILSLDVLIMPPDGPSNGG
jgi:hypothetical protein